ncbi:MAG: hypothetical protein ACREXY_00745 [Gammaproteobacteria bacterium]
MTRRDPAPSSHRAWSLASGGIFNFISLTEIDNGASSLRSTQGPALPIEVGAFFGDRTV